MYQYISTIYLLVSNLIYVLFFCYLYQPIYISCNVQKKIKKNGKSKIVSQPKSVLALGNLILLYVLFKCFTFKIILFGLLSITIVFLFLIDKISPKLNDSLYNLNKSSLMIISWKFIHTIFTLIYVVTEPLFSGINGYINKKLIIIKNLITNIANLSMTEGSENIFKKELLKMSEEMSNMSDYVFKSKKKEHNKNEKNVENISDINSKDITKSSTNPISLTENSEVLISELGELPKIPETNISLSKCEIKKKLDKINNIINETNNNIIEDMTITITEN